MVCYNDHTYGLSQLSNIMSVTTTKHNVCHNYQTYGVSQRSNIWSVTATKHNVCHNYQTYSLAQLSNIWSVTTIKHIICHNDQTYGLSQLPNIMSVTTIKHMVCHNYQTYGLSQLSNIWSVTTIKHMVCHSNQTYATTYGSECSLCNVVYTLLKTVVCKTEFVNLHQTLPPLFPRVKYWHLAIESRNERLARSKGKTVKLPVVSGDIPYTYVLATVALYEKHMDVCNPYSVHSIPARVA